MIVHLRFPKNPRYIKAFRKGYDSLRVEDAPKVSALLANLLGQSPAYISLKMNGTRGINEYEEETVRLVFKSFGIDAFTGETIQNS